MAKFAVSYMEVYRNTYIVEAENYEEAEEKLRKLPKSANWQKRKILIIGI